MTKETVAGTYEPANNCLCCHGTGRNCCSGQKQCNFVPKILSEVLAGDGTELASRVQISGAQRKILFV